MGKYMKYIGVEYEIHLHKLKYDLGYSGYGIVYLPTQKNPIAKQISSSRFDHFDSKDEAQRHLKALVQKYIDENI